MKKILITGAGSGLGSDLSRCYAEEGNHIILVGRTKEKLDGMVSELNKKNASAEYILCDVSNIDEVKQLARHVRSKHTKIDYLINNAGVGYFGPLEELSIEEMNTMIDVNVKGTIMVTQMLLPYINDRVLNIISTAGLRGKPNEAAYCASKFAIRGFTESLQKELFDSNIKVTAVYMGGMNTPFWEKSTHIKDKSRLKSSLEVANEIKLKDDGRLEIII